MNRLNCGWSWAGIVTRICIYTTHVKPVSSQSRYHRNPRFIRCITTPQRRAYGVNQLPGTDPFVAELDPINVEPSPAFVKWRASRMSWEMRLGSTSKPSLTFPIFPQDFQNDIALIAAFRLQLHNVYIWKSLNLELLLSVTRKYKTKYFWIIKTNKLCLWF